MKTLILVDVGNLYFEDKNVDYAKLIGILKKGREVYKAVAFVVETGAKREGNFFNYLANLGFEVRKKMGIGKLKANWDTGIVIECLRFSDEVDEVTLVSGDGDYIPLLRELKRKRGNRIRVRVVAFNSNCSWDLRKEADEFIPLRRQ